MFQKLRKGEHSTSKANLHETISNRAPAVSLPEEAPASGSQSSPPVPSAAPAKLQRRKSWVMKKIEKKNTLKHYDDDKSESGILSMFSEKEKVYQPPNDKLVANALDLFIGAMQRPVTGLHLKDRKNFFKTIKGCFSACKAIDWLVSNCFVTRPKAIQIASVLVGYHCIAPVTKNTPGFSDDKVYYTFTFTAKSPSEEELLLLLNALEAFAPGILHDIDDEESSEAHTSPVSTPRERADTAESLQSFEEKSSPLRKNSVSFKTEQQCSASTLLKDIEKFNTIKQRKKTIRQSLPALEDLKFEIVNGTCRVRTATLSRLLELLVNSPTLDSQYRDAILCTYKLFTTPEALFNEVTSIWQNNLLFREQDPKYMMCVEQKLIAFMKVWFDKYPKDLEPLTPIIASFLTECVVPKYPIGARLIEMLTSPEPPVRLKYDFAFPKNGEYIPTPNETFLEWDVAEIANQMSLYHHHLYLQIQESELLGQAWNKADKKQILAPNITVLIGAFNRLSSLIMTEILDNMFLKDRVAIVQKTIDLISHLITARDFFGCMAIFSALNSAPIQRLKKTWEALPPELKEKMETINESLSHNKNYSVLRSAIKNAPLPLVPHIALYLQDLTFIDEIPTFVGPNLINFSKCWKLQAVLSEIFEFQKARFAIEPNQSILNWLINKPTKKDEEIYSISLKVEPRDLEKAMEQMMEKETQYQQQVRKLEVQNDSLIKAAKFQKRTEELLRQENSDAIQLLIKARDYVTDPELLQAIERLVTTSISSPKLVNATAVTAMALSGKKIPLPGLRDLSCSVQLRPSTSPPPISPLAQSQ